MTPVRLRGTCLLLLPVILGCTTKAETTKKTKSNLPAPKVESDLAGRYLLKIGRGQDLKQPGSRWCYLDVRTQDTKLLVDAWRPDQEVKVTQSELKHDGQILLSLKRSWLKGEEEIPVNETWTLKGFLRPLPRTVKRKPKPKRNADGEIEEPEEEEETEAEEVPRGLAGQAKVTVAQAAPTTVSYSFAFTAAPVPADEEQPWEDPPSRRPAPKPTMADLERAFKAGKLDFDSVPPELKDEVRKKFGS